MKRRKSPKFSNLSLKSINNSIIEGTANGLNSIYDDKISNNGTHKFENKKNKSKQTRFACNECENVYKQLSSLNRHKKKIHSNINTKTHICQICSSAFHSKYQLTVHYRTHTNERPYLCNYEIENGEVCGMRFRQNSHLLTHLRTHTKEKPYECKICHKRFTQSSSVTTHMRIHQAIKPFACPYCLQGFTQKHSRDRHVESKHDPNSTINILKREKKRIKMVEKMAKKEMKKKKKKIKKKNQKNNNFLTRFRPPLRPLRLPPGRSRFRSRVYNILPSLPSLPNIMDNRILNNFDNLSDNMSDNSDISKFKEDVELSINDCNVIPSIKSTIMKKEQSCSSILTQKSSSSQPILKSNNNIDVEYDNHNDADNVAECDIDGLAAINFPSLNNMSTPFIDYDTQQINGTCTHDTVIYDKLIAIVLNGNNNNNKSNSNTPPIDLPLDNNDIKMKDQYIEPLMSLPLPDDDYINTPQTSSNTNQYSSISRSNSVISVCPSTSLSRSQSQSHSVRTPPSSSSFTFPTIDQPYSPLNNSNNNDNNNLAIEATSIANDNFYDNLIAMNDNTGVNVNDCGPDPDKTTIYFEQPTMEMDTNLLPPPLEKENNNYSSSILPITISSINVNKNIITINDIGSDSDDDSENELIIKPQIQSDKMKNEDIPLLYLCKQIQNHESIKISMNINNKNNKIEIKDIDRRNPSNNNNNYVDSGYSNLMIRNNVINNNNNNNNNSNSNNGNNNCNSISTNTFNDDLSMVNWSGNLLHDHRGHDYRQNNNDNSYNQQLYSFNFGSTTAINDVDVDIDDVDDTNNDNYGASTAIQRIIQPSIMNPCNYKSLSTSPTALLFNNTTFQSSQTSLCDNRFHSSQTPFNIGVEMEMEMNNNNFVSIIEDKQITEDDDSDSESTFVNHHNINLNNRRRISTNTINID